MKNFVLACLAFLIWALFGAWVHAYTHPKQKVNPIKIVKTKPLIIVKDTVQSKAKETIQVKIKDSVFKTPKISPVKTIAKKVIYLDFNQMDFDEDTILESYATKLKGYIKTNPKLNIYIVGFTDTVGDSISNYWVGFERARNFKSFLVSQDIDKNIIHTSSKGEKDPIAKNNSKKERRKNRRIEITLKPKPHD
ncbi:MAG: OmpA family protein [Flavobacteriaceae bacterium]